MSHGRMALVVAVDHYDHPALHQLAAPAADAEALAGVLGDPDLGDFDVRVLHNPTSWTTCQQVEELLAGRDPTDLVLLHFSCHGLKDDTGALYLAATNTRPDLLGSTAVDAAWVNRVMHRSRAQSVVLLLDCCYGGAFERGLISRAGGDVDVGDQFRQPQLGEGRGRVVITASTAMEYSFEGAQLTDGSAAPSVFTGALVEGIRTGDADRNQDGQVSLAELYEFVYDRVRRHSPNQTPSKWEFGLRGDLFVARNPHRRVRAALLAPELVGLVRHPLPAARLAAVQELTPVAGGPDLMLAAAARLAVQELIDDDSRVVSAAAIAALEQTEVRLSAGAIDLGQVTPGGPPAVGEVEVFGGPLAWASTVTAEVPVRARITESTLRVVWTPNAPGDLDVTVTLAGPAGTTHLRVVGRASPPTPKAEPEAVARTAPPVREAPVAVDTAGPAPRRDRRNDPESTPGPARRLFAAAALLILAALTVVVVWANNREQDAPATTGPTALPGGARDYAALINMLPASFDRYTCDSLKPESGASAAAHCSPGVHFRLWKTKADMDARLTFLTIKLTAGDCGSAPQARTPIVATVPAGRHPGRLICRLEHKNGGSGAPYYFVIFGLDDLLMTGEFPAKENLAAKDYPKLYSTAVDVLRQLP